MPVEISALVLLLRGIMGLAEPNLDAWSIESMLKFSLPGCNMLRDKPNMAQDF